MGGESQAEAGQQIEIRAKSELNFWSWFPVIMPIAIGIVVVFLISGIRDALYLLLTAIASGSFVFSPSDTENFTARSSTARE